MSSTQRPTTRRRSARHAFDEDDSAPVKRTKTDAPTAAGKQSAATTAAHSSSKSNGRTKKVVASYDEDDDGFTFSRTRSKKRPQAKSVAQISEEPKQDATSAPAKTQPPDISANQRRKKQATQLIEDDEHPRRRRSARLSGEKAQAAGIDQDLQPRKSSGRGSKRAVPPAKSVQQDDGGGLQNGDQELRVDKKRKGPASPGNDAEHKAEAVALTMNGGDKAHATKIALPFADTPVIRRNKEMRRGGKNGERRRSSSGIRGRRASSLIESGTSNAVPHTQLEVETFYKHIEQTIPEPRRMKQLLTWCGTRALPDKPTGNVNGSSAIMAARAIQQELLDDFANKLAMSNWFDREDASPTALVKKPNPRNAQNAAKLIELEAEVSRLQKEKKAWDDLLAQSSRKHEEPKSIKSERAKRQMPTVPPSITSIHPDLLDDPDQAAILSSLTSNLPSTADTSNTLAPKPPAHKDQHPTSQNADTGLQTSGQDSLKAVINDSLALNQRLKALTRSLEPTIDAFAQGVHTLSQYRLTAERTAGHVLGSAAIELEKRDRDAKEEAGTAGMGVDGVLGALGGLLGGRR